jgi:GT2 family glycosyltransferase
MMDVPLISILIVTWNRRTEVDRAIRSALSQTYLRLEVVVLDNASSDGTAEFIETHYPEIRLVRLDENLGCPSGRNVGFRSCRGEWIYQLDDDGWLDCNAISAAVSRASTDPRIGVVMSRIHEVQGEHVVRRLPDHIETPAYLSVFSGGCSMIRRDALVAAGGYPDDFFRQGEEGDLALRLYDSGFSSVLEPTSVMFHRPSPVGRSTKAFLRFSLVNSNKTGLRLWPFPWCCLRPVLNMVYALRGMILLRYWRLPLDVMVALVRDLRTLRQTRRPVSRRAFRVSRRLHRGPSGTLGALPDGSYAAMVALPGSSEADAELLSVPRK